MNWFNRLRQPDTPHADTQAIGADGEQQALEYLQQQGLRLIERNFRCKCGEIDLIMQHDAQLVFVEVRLRQAAHFGGAAASVTPQKQRKLALTAQYYLQRYTSPPRCRFDLIAIDGGKLTWLRDLIFA